MGLIDQIRAGQYRPDDAVSPVVPGRILSLAEVAQLMEAGSGQLEPVREFLAQVSYVDDQTAEQMIDEPPGETTEEGDVVLGAIAEMVASQRDIPCPRWAIEPNRFLDRLWFVGEVDGLRAVALVQTPIALKRRGIIWSARSLTRV